MQDRVPGNIAACFRTKNQPDSRIISVRAFHFIVHADVHIHLADILMRNLGSFQVDEQEAFENEIVEYKVDVIITRIG